MTTEPTTLQSRIREMMEEKNWKVGDVAQIADVSSSAVSQWIGGQTKSLGVEATFYLSEASGYRPLWLAVGKGPKK